MKEKVIEILKNYRDTGDRTITETSSLRTDLELDSFDMMNVIVDLEDAFEVRIHEEDVGGLHTVGDILKYLRSHSDTSGLDPAATGDV